MDQRMPVVVGRDDNDVVTLPGMLDKNDGSLESLKGLVSSSPRTSTEKGLFDTAALASTFAGNANDYRRARCHPQPPHGLEERERRRR